MRSRDLRLRIFLKNFKIFDFFFVYFFELTNSDSKKTKTIFCPLWGQVTWDLEFFWYFSKFSIFFSFIFTNWLILSRKKRKRFFTPLWGQVTWDLEFFKLFAYFDFFPFSEERLKRQKQQQKQKQKVPSNKYYWNEKENNGYKASSNKAS